MATSAGESVLFVGTRFSNLYTAVDTASVYDSICQIGSLLAARPVFGTACLGVLGCTYEVHIRERWKVPRVSDSLVSISLLFSKLLPYPITPSCHALCYFAVSAAFAPFIAFSPLVNLHFPY
jgi:hypothetical protein